MITVIVDDKKFTLSLQTLNSNPQFTITQILNGLIPANSNPFIERINETTFEVDMDSQQFAQIVQDLRKESRTFFVAQQNQNKTGSIFQKPHESDNVDTSNMNINTMMRQFGRVMTSTTDAHELRSIDPMAGQTGNKTHYVLKPRKIELDTSEHKN